MVNCYEAEQFPIDLAFPSCITSLSSVCVLWIALLGPEQKVKFKFSKNSQFNPAVGIEIWIGATTYSIGVSLLIAF